MLVTSVVVPTLGDLQFDDTQLDVSLFDNFKIVFGEIFNQYRGTGFLTHDNGAGVVQYEYTSDVVNLKVWVETRQIRYSVSVMTTVKQVTTPVWVYWDYRMQYTDKTLLMRIICDFGMLVARCMRLTGVPEDRGDLAPEATRAGKWTRHEAEIEILSPVRYADKRFSQVYPIQSNDAYQLARLQTADLLKWFEFWFDTIWPMSDAMQAELQFVTEERVHLQDMMDDYAKEHPEVKNE